MTHQLFRDEIPAYIAGRLTSEDRDRLEKHLGQCSDCRTVAALGRDLARAAGEAGETLFEPHPSGEDLRRFATGHAAPEVSERITRHVDLCMSCELEVQAWRARGALPASSRLEEARPMPGGRSSWSTSRLPWVAILSVAAGLLLGVAIGAVLWRNIPGARAHGPDGAHFWAGATAQVLLPGALRGEGTPAVTHRVSGNEERVVLSFPSLDSGFRNGRALYRFEISGASSGVILSQSMTASEARRHIEAATVITFDLPAALLPPGRYDCRVMAPDGTVLYQAALEIEKGD